MARLDRVNCSMNVLLPREPHGHQQDHQNSNHAEVAIFVMMTKILFDIFLTNINKKEGWKYISTKIILCHERGAITLNIYCTWCGQAVK